MGQEDPHAVGPQFVLMLEAERWSLCSPSQPFPHTAAPLAIMPQPQLPAHPFGSRSTQQVPLLQKEAVINQTHKKKHIGLLEKLIRAVETGQTNISCAIMQGPGYGCCKGNRLVTLHKRITQCTGIVIKYFPCNISGSLEPREKGTVIGALEQDGNSGG